MLCVWKINKCFAKTWWNKLNENSQSEMIIKHFSNCFSDSFEKIMFLQNFNIDYIECMYDIELESNLFHHVNYN